MARQQKLRTSERKAGLDRADAAQRALLEQGLGDRRLTDHQVGVLQRILVDTGALDDVEQQITDLTHQGVDAIRGGAVPDGVATGLADLALTIAGRTA